MYYLQRSPSDNYRIAADGALSQLVEHRLQRTAAFPVADPVTLQRSTGPQAVVLAAIHIHHLHMLLDGGNGRQKALAIEAIGIQLTRRLIGCSDDHHALLKHHLEQTAQDDRIANIGHEQLIETQYADLFGQLAGKRLQRICGAVEGEQAHMHPTHEVMEMLPPGRGLQAAMEDIHQPGLATPHRSPEIDTGWRRSDSVGLMQRLVTGLQ